MGFETEIMPSSTKVQQDLNYITSITSLRRDEGSERAR